MYVHPVDGYLVGEQQVISGEVNSSRKHVEEMRCTITATSYPAIFLATCLLVRPPVSTNRQLGKD